MRTLRQFGLFMQWQLRRQGMALPVYLALQVIIAAAITLGYGLIVGDVDHRTSLFLSTASMTVCLLMLGLVVAPQTVADTRAEGGYEWMLTLPVPRAAFVLGDMLVWMALALPGLISCVLVAGWRYGLEFSPSWSVVPAVLLVAFCATAIGYVPAVTFGKVGTLMCTQVFIMGTMLFTPIAYPAERLPAWGRSLHEWLPFESMGHLVRGGMSPQEFPVDSRPWAVVACWAVAGFTASLVMLRRRC
ncbi:ABC-type transport system involved in multi-copper enzyme maturation, permease component [Actinomyces bovis]|uniref:ABC-type transport system involved in multi-copper enzyme maturation, permease component n=1 Tax=Actinomyces bovis TaxID=1658 RepID=A0ABY1VN58_9ACTO|nr:ABC transporter permease [Actinomyces bovis]SPT53539.1 ABC-type transport system involved in multi-copper enzyme maturation, permease component [Actinomyces bovis]VEG55499.1 ABC-type transport system involved in multi-copper enzyme maturation, permease component [Actinomyces israelii]